MAGPPTPEQYHDYLSSTFNPYGPEGPIEYDVCRDEADVAATQPAGPALWQIGQPGYDGEHGYPYTSSDPVTIGGGILRRLKVERLADEGGDPDAFPGIEIGDAYHGGPR